MPENNIEGAEVAKKSSSPKPMVVIAIGCFVLLVVVGAALSWGIKFFGKSMLSGAIESQTGVKTNLKDLEDGKMTFTDKKTGQTVNVGTDTLPETFPKDFPVYPGAKVASTVSGSQAGGANGMFVTFTTGDEQDKVVKYYTEELTKNGWTTTASFNSESMQTWTVSKSKTEGSVTVTSESGQTTLLVTLGDKAE